MLLSDRRLSHHLRLMLVHDARHSLLVLQPLPGLTTMLTAAGSLCFAPRLLVKVTFRLGRLLFASHSRPVLHPRLSLTTTTTPAGSLFFVPRHSVTAMYRWGKLLFAIERLAILRLFPAMLKEVRSLHMQLPRINIHLSVDSLTTVARYLPHMQVPRISLHLSVDRLVTVARYLLVTNHIVSLHLQTEAIENEERNTLRSGPRRLILSTRYRRSRCLTYLKRC